MFEISTVLITGTVIFLVIVLAGVLTKPTFFDEDSRLFGLWMGVIFGGSAGTAVMVIMVILHFVSKFW